MLAALLAGAESAKSLCKKARKAEKAGNYAQAYVWYAEAAAMDARGRTKAWGHSLALRTRALREINQLPPGLGTKAGDAAAPADQRFLGHITRKDLEEAAKPLPPLELQATPGARDFNLQGSVRSIYERVSRAYGLKVVFDGDYAPSKPIRLRIQRANYREALRILGAATGTFQIPVSEKMILVAKDTVQKRRELESNVAVVVPIPETVSVQEAQELAQAVQQLMEIKKLVIDAQQRLVLIRDRVSRVRPAQMVFAQLLHSRPEVVVDFDLMEFSKTSKTRYGLDLPGSFPIMWLTKWMGNASSISSSLLNFATFGGGITTFGIGIANAELFASMSRSSAKTLLRGEVRTADGQTATLHVGDKYPIQTQGYFGRIEGSGKVYTPPPTINFEDLGVVVKLTPHIHGSNEITLKVDAKFRVLTGQSLNGIPIISNRSLQSVVRLKNDEWAVMAGLVRRSEVRTISGIAGLSQIPHLGILFRKSTTTKESGQTLLVLKPRLVRLPVAEFMTRQIWTGTETRPRCPL